jgi:hypothetical protein
MPGIWASVPFVKRYRVCVCVCVRVCALALTTAGDFGFDPLGLLDPANSGGFVEPKWLQYSEVSISRFARTSAT